MSIEPKKSENSDLRNRKYLPFVQTRELDIPIKWYKEMSFSARMSSSGLSSFVDIISLMENISFGILFFEYNIQYDVKLY